MTLKRGQRYTLPNGRVAIIRKVDRDAGMMRIEYLPLTEEEYDSGSFPSEEWYEAPELKKPESK